MDVKNTLARIYERLGKYRYAILILLLGVALMCWPKRGQESAEIPETMPIQDQDETLALSEKDLEEILRWIEGAGEVKVLLTYKAGSKRVYHQDETVSTNASGTANKEETVILDGTDRQENAIISQVLGPIYQGAVVLCKGADQPSVKLAIVEAVSKATGLGVDAICVLKMK